MDSKTTLYKNYHLLKLEAKSVEIDIQRLNIIIERLSGGPQDVTAQSYETGYSKNVVPLEDVYNSIIQAQALINYKKIELNGLNKLLAEIEANIADFVKMSNDAEIAVFYEHFVKGVKVEQVKAKKQRGTGYLSVKQVRKYITEINHKIKGTE